MSELINIFLDYFIHLDETLNTVISNYGTLTYVLLGAVIFIETGLVIMPLLPGDSLLFAAGTFAALGSLNIWILWIMLTILAILGDTLNYWIGNKLGPKVFESNNRFLKRSYLDKTQAFYDKHGGKTIILARFVPIIRTFAPFIAGVGSMSYKRFVTFNIVGAIAWVTLFLGLGYFFGNIPFVKDNFETVILAIIFLSILPPIIEYIKEKRK